MIECDALVMDAAFLAADAQGGDDVVGALQRLARIAAEAESNVAANALEYALREGAVDRQMALIGIHKHHFGNADAMGVIGDGFGEERERTPPPPRTVNFIRYLPLIKR